MRRNSKSSWRLPESYRRPEALFFILMWRGLQMYALATGFRAGSTQVKLPAALESLMLFVLAPEPSKSALPRQAPIPPAYG